MMEPGMVNPEPAMAAPEPVIELGGQKKSKAPVIVAVLCVILAVAGIGFGVFGMMQGMNKEGKKEEVSEQKPEEKEEDYTIYRSLVERYVSWNYTERELVENALKGNINDINYIMHVGLYGVRPAGGANQSMSVSRSEISSYFENEVELPEEFSLRCFPWNREIMSDGGEFADYTAGIGGCGGTTMLYSLYDIDNVEEKDGVLNIGISYGWIRIELAGSEAVLYRANDVAVKTIEIDADGGDTGEDELKEYFYEHPDEFDHYILTFKKEDRHYYLADSSKAE